MRDNKGVNLITISIAIVILILITSILVYVSNDAISVKKVKNLYNDIDDLNDKVSAYYLQNNKLPILDLYASNPTSIKDESINLPFINALIENNVMNINDGKDYYIIDLKALDELDKIG